MGGGSWSNDYYEDKAKERATSGASTFAHHDSIKYKPREEQRVHARLDPKGIRVRESRDSLEHPESLAIGVMLDETGSMQSVPMTVHAKLPNLHKIAMTLGIRDPQFLFGAVGDEFSDKGSLQVGQYESDNRMDDDLAHFWLEGNGGGGLPRESYQNAIYFFARHTDIDCQVKRNKKGYCNTPEAPIWMADQTFKRIGDVCPGDKVMGWVKDNGKRRLTIATVEAMTSNRADHVICATMASGRRVQCTRDHRWLSGHHKLGQSDTWTSVAYDQGPTRRDGKRLGTLSEVLNPEVGLGKYQLEAAWLAGIYDGEGHEASICQYRTSNPEVCDRIERTLNLLGFRWVYRDSQYFLLGGLETYIRLLSLPITRRQQLLNLITKSKYTKYTRSEVATPVLSRTIDPVMEVKSLKSQEVVSMQTTTGNYIAWGYASSNCFILGDENPYEVVRRSWVSETLGYNLEGSDISTADIIKECQQKYHIFFVIPSETNHGREPGIINGWKERLGPENVLTMPSASDVCELVATTVGVCEGLITLDQAKVLLSGSGVSSKAASNVGDALYNLVKAKGLPVSTPKVRRL